MKLLTDFGLTEWNAMFISSKESPLPEKAMATEIGIQKGRGSRY